MRYTDKTEKRVFEELKKIQSKIPKHLLEAAVTVQKATPTIKMVFEKALESDTISEEKKQEIRDQLATGKYDREIVVENAKYTKMIDNFVSREINKAIKEGRLPPRSHIKNFPSMKKFYENEKTSD